ncbi:hypothetical protein SAMN04488527_101288 [Aliiroseovarius crassostreae]|uniref:HTH cro/C1-type domain-containing protein n=1 Tax=Aliiroseovarius crassostreae TaxID=154981 RepID=A0A0P7IX91_9RHOB|nr:helix-turn-helix transcriptional regulator [Aliiroseovarius crassostreae]KPN64285.1 hypothetical protein AKJ29_16765 [Aliiroseovarius crassostreae]SFU31662.1 hypothetical protein SAMN04488527_101288 [Aliiroseovarius crassostreae]
MKQGFGERIRSEMNTQGLTDPMLAADLGTHTRNLNNWINERSEPKFSTLCAIGEELELNLHWILTGEGPMEPPTNTTCPANLPHPTPTGDQSRATSPEGGTSSPSGAFTTPHNMTDEAKAQERLDRDRRVRLAATVARNKQRQEDLEIIRKIEALTKEFRTYSHSRPTLTEHPMGGEGAGSDAYLEKIKIGPDQRSIYHDLTEERPIWHRLYQTLAVALFWFIWAVGVWAIIYFSLEALK